MTIIDPFDFERIFISILAGSPEIFTALAIVFISGLAGYFRLDNRITLIMFIIFGIVMSTYIGAFYILIILMLGIVSFYSLARMFNR